MANPTPVIPPPGPGRPKGSKNALPSPAKMLEYRRSLHAQAAGGDTLALIGVVLIDTLERQPDREGQ